MEAQVLSQVSQVSHDTIQELGYRRQGRETAPFALAPVVPVAQVPVVPQISPVPPVVAFEVSKWVAIDYSQFLALSQGFFNRGKCQLRSYSSWTIMRSLWKWSAPTRMGLTRIRPLPIWDQSVWSRNWNVDHSS
jgi:DNA topoisomerase IB